MVYRSPNAPTKQDVPGILLLAILAGHKRYALIPALRGDTVSAHTLIIERIISEDAMRRALTRIDEEQSRHWLRPALLNSVLAALKQSSILDIQASPGNQHSSSHAKVGLAALLDEL